jgi:hypothetical protein
VIIDNDVWEGALSEAGESTAAYVRDGSLISGLLGFTAVTGSPWT